MKGAWAVLAAVGLVCVAWAASRQNHPAARVLAGAFCGLGALGAVNLLGSYTGTPANDEDERPTQDADDL